MQFTELKSYQNPIGADKNVKYIKKISLILIHCRSIHQMITHTLHTIRAGLRGGGKSVNYRFWGAHELFEKFFFLLFI